MKCVFMGEYEVSTDDKHRVIMPSKWRERAGVELVISQGFEGSLELWPKDRFMEMIEKFDDDNRFLKNVRVLKRKIIGGSREVSMDRWFRFSIPSSLFKEHLNDNQLILRGNLGNIEIWSKKKYDEWSNSDDNSLEKAAADYCELKNISF